MASVFPNGCPQPLWMHLDVEGDLSFEWQDDERSINLYINADGTVFAIMTPANRSAEQECPEGADVVPAMRRWFAPHLKRWDEGTLNESEGHDGNV